MVRDHDGKLILAASIPLSNVSVPMGETITAWNAVEVVILCIGAMKLWVEGDALGIIQAIRKGRGVEGYVENLLKDIKTWLWNLQD